MKITTQAVQTLIQGKVGHNRSVQGRASPRQDSIILSDLAKTFATTQRMLADHIAEKSAFEFSDESLVFDNGLDLSPEGISNTVVEYASDLYVAFEEQNGHLDPKELNQRFETKIRTGINGGYDRAAAILDGMQTPKDVRAYSLETKELIDRKLDVLIASLNVGVADASGSDAESEGSNAIAGSAAVDAS